MGSVLWGFYTPFAAAHLFAQLAGAAIAAELQDKELDYNSFSPFPALVFSTFYVHMAFLPSRSLLLQFYSVSFGISCS